MDSGIDEVEIACKNAVAAHKSEIKDMQEQYGYLVKMLDYEQKERRDTEDNLFALEDKFSSLEEENKKLRRWITFLRRSRYTLGEVEKIYMHGLMSHKPRKEPKIIGNSLDRINKYNRLCGKR